MKNILVPIDFTEHENQVLDKAIELARVFDSKIWLLHVAEPEPEFVGFGVGPQYIRTNRALELKNEHRKLNEYCDQIKKEKLDCQGILIEGATVDMIIEKAKKLSIELIVTGHHEHNFLYKAFFGSVASGVIKKANIPVLVVPLAIE